MLSSRLARLTQHPLSDAVGAPSEPKHMGTMAAAPESSTTFARALGRREDCGAVRVRDRTLRRTSDAWPLHGCDLAPVRRQTFNPSGRTRTNRSLAWSQRSTRASVLKM